jgi:ribosome assembly protein YihI (activator of Der GTPase)
MRFRKLADVEEMIQALDRKELQRRAALRNGSYTMAEAEHHTHQQNRYKAERKVLVDELQALFPS